MLQFVLAFLVVLLRLLAFIVILAIDWALTMGLFRWLTHHGGVDHRRWELMIVLCCVLSTDVLLPINPSIAPAFLAATAGGMGILGALLGVVATNPSPVRRRACQ